MIEIFKLSLLLSLSIIGALIIFGFLIGKIESKSNELIYSKLGKYGIIGTGIIGTTIHEFSHALLCKIFLHKITDIKWFSLNIEDRELGHVNHTFNKNSIYQRVGNFFIGVAPILVGSILLTLFYKIFLDNSFNTILENINVNSYLYLGKNFNLIDFFKLLLNQFILFLKSTFTINNLSSISFWIFLFIAISISTHMSLSKADLKNSLDGIIFIFIISVVISIVLVVFKIPETIILNRLIVFNVFLISFLSIGIFFSLITLIISKIISLF